MNQITRRVFGVAGFALLLATSASFAQQPPPVRIRGQIEKIEGDVLDIKTRNGYMVKVKLVDPGRVVAFVKASLADIQVGKFIGVTAMPQADGSQKAIAVHIFLDSQKGVVADRHFPWDLQPGSTMTNAIVDTTAGAVHGRAGADGGGGWLPAPRQGRRGGGGEGEAHRQRRGLWGGQGDPRRPQAGRLHRRRRDAAGRRQPARYSSHDLQRS